MATVPASLYFLRGQVSFVQRSGFDLHAISSPGEYLDAFREMEGIPVHSVPMTRRMTPLEDLRAAWKLWRILRSIRPDIVHAHTPKGGLLGMMAAWLARTPVRVYHLRGSPFVTAKGLRRWLLRSAELTSCALAHRTIAVSESLRAIAVQEGLCPREKITVLAGGSGNGVDAAGRFRPLGEAMRRESRAGHGVPPEARVIGFVGRLVREKGIEELAAAWRTLRDRHGDLHLLLVGARDPREPTSRRVTTELETDPRVHFTGPVLDVPRLYSAMDVVALPTYREGFPNVALETAAMALPIVATSVPGCVDAVQDGKTGTLVPARDAVALAAALERYLSDAALRKQHGEAARQRVLQDFRPEAIWAAMVSEYRALLASHA